MAKSLLILTLLLSIAVQAYGPNDDTHNHDGTHPPGPKDCGTNYMLPGAIARLGSHSFMILGAEDESHIIAEHRSGTPPHNYQFLFRVRLDKEEMKQYREIQKSSKTLPAFTTIYFDENLKQLDRTFFCLPDLPKIFGDQKKKGDEFDRLFPIRASLQVNPDHEGSFDIAQSVARGKYITLERDDFELTVYRYLPSYLPQDLLRKAIKEKKSEILPLLSHSPLSANESMIKAKGNGSYMKGEGSIEDKTKSCPKNYYLKNTPVYAGIHSFLLMGEIGENAVVAVHYYDFAPQNFQTALRLNLSREQMKIFRAAKAGSKSPVLLQTILGGKPSQFCMEEIRTIVKSPEFILRGTLYKDSVLDNYKLGKPSGELTIAGKNIDVLVNRRLESYMNPLAVAQDVLGTSK